MGKFTVPEVADGAVFSPQMHRRIIGTNGFRCLNQLDSGCFDDSTNIPVTALATPYANFTWNGCNHETVSTAGAASVALKITCPVLEWSQLVSIAACAPVVGTPTLLVYHSCAHTATSVRVGSVVMVNAYTVYSSTGLLGGTTRQLHAGDLLTFRMRGAVATGGLLVDPCIALRFKRNPIP